MSTDDFKLPDDIELLKAIIAARETAHSIALLERERVIAQYATTINQHVATIDQHVVSITQHATIITQHSTIITQHVAVIAQHEEVIAAQHDTIEKQLKKLERQYQQIARLLRRQYGPQRERIDPNQLTLFTVEELTQLAAELAQGKVDSVTADHSIAAQSTAASASSLCVRRVRRECRPRAKATAADRERFAGTRLAGSYDALEVRRLFTAVSSGRYSLSQRHHHSSQHTV